MGAPLFYPGYFHYRAYVNAYNLILSVPFAVADQARKEFSEVETQISSIEARVS